MGEHLSYQSYLSIESNQIAGADTNQKEKGGVPNYGISTVDWQMVRYRGVCWCMCGGDERNHKGGDTKVVQYNRNYPRSYDHHITFVVNHHHRSKVYITIS